MSFSDHSQLLTIKKLEYAAEFPEENGFCPHDDCLPSIGVNVTGRDGLIIKDCMEKDSDNYFCIKPSKIKWNGQHFIFDGISERNITLYYKSKLFGEDINCHL